jgi:PPOX class probable F420-dependent enzyme
MPDASPTLGPREDEFLRAHRWAILATGRRDGSPQQSMVGYAVLDDGRLAISVKAYTAKWHNALRQPRVSLAVPDGRAHLVLNGTAECIDADPRRAELTADVFAALGGGERPDPDSLRGVLDEQQRTVLLVTAEGAHFHE